MSKKDECSWVIYSRRISMTKQRMVQAELNGRFGAVNRNDASGTRRTFETREAAQAHCDERNGDQHD